MIRVNCRCNVHISKVNLRTFLPLYVSNASVRLAHTNKVPFGLKTNEKRSGTKPHYRDGNNAVSKLRNAAVKRSAPIANIVVNERPRKGLMAKRALVDKLQGKVNAMQPRRSFTAIAIRDHLMRLKKMSTQMFQALGKTVASSNKDEVAEDTAEENIEHYIKVEDPTQLEHATFKLAQEISASIQKDLMPLDKKTRAMLSFFKRSDPRKPHQTNERSLTEFDNTANDELKSSSLNSDPMHLSSPRTDIRVIDQLGNVPQKVPSSHIMKISPILVGRRLNDMYLSTTKEPHNRYNYFPLSGTFGSPRKYKVFPNITVGHSTMPIRYSEL